VLVAFTATLAVAAGLVALAVGLLTGLGWWPVLLGLVAGTGLARLHVQRVVDRVLTSVRAAPLVGAARLENLVDGLCVAHGIAHPQLMVVEAPSRNGFIVGLTPRDTTLVVTRGLVEGLTRIELEGVVARELALVKSGHTSLATVVAAVAQLWAGAPARLLPERTDLYADLDGVGYTRYPPGLIAALEKVAVDAGVPAAPRWTRHLWIEDPGTPAVGRAGSIHSPIDERIATLREL
jgi:heat shock protein HtpX